MGQLEKYGLYVLCLVIFLILGVAIWGGEPPRPSSGAPANQLMLAGGPGSTGSQPKVSAPEAAKKETASVPLGDLFTSAPRGKPGGEKPKDDKGADKNAGKEAGTAPAKDGTANPAPAADAVRPTYKVKHGDTLESIAKDQLGSKALVKEILHLNPKVEPTLLRVGKELLLPSKAELRKTEEAARIASAVPATGKTGAAKPADAAANKATTPKVEAAKTPRTYEITKGDTFTGIAKRIYGSEKRADAIKELNPNLDPSKLRVGQTIRLPGD